MTEIYMDLTLFDAEGAPEGAAEGAEGGGEGTAEGAQEKTPEQMEAEFDALIKGEYKDIYGKRVKGAVFDRFKTVKQTEAELKKANEVLEVLRANYGKDDPDELIAAMRSDDGMIERRADANGLTIEQQRMLDDLTYRAERGDKAIKEREEEQQRAENVARWRADEAEARQVYPSLDLNAEVNDPETGEGFMRLLMSGVDVRTAFEVTHKDDIIGGAMQYTAQKVKEKVTNDIRARGMRPPENGAQGSSAARVVKNDPSKWSEKEMQDVLRRVKAGERIVL